MARRLRGFAYTYPPHPGEFEATLCLLVVILLMRASAFRLPYYHPCLLPTTCPATTSCVFGLAPRCMELYTYGPKAQGTTPPSGRDTTLSVKTTNAEDG